MSNTQPKTNRNATLAFILGLVGFFSFGLILGIPAIIVGNKAKREIRESNGAMSGDRLATWGIVLGWIAAVVTTIALVIAAIAFLG
ncbi:MAG: DUF4190 domain-containing protein [Acidimicrobiia bacterium]|nr:DUF4190 domain-containing protein [Acidimicrobiia bacterium]